MDEKLKQKIDGLIREDVAAAVIEAVAARTREQYVYYLDEVKRLHKVVEKLHARLDVFEEAAKNSEQQLRGVVEQLKASEAAAKRETVFLERLERELSGE